MAGLQQTIAEHNAQAKPRANTQPEHYPVLKQDNLLQKYKLQDLVGVWKRHKQPRLTSYILKKLQPSIQSAITSYSGTSASQMTIPAAKITLQALQAYDPKKGASVSTHVFHALKRLNRIGAARQNIVHIPQNARLLYGSVCREQALLQDKLGRQPTIQELADKTGISQKKLKSIFQSQTTVSQSSTQNLYQGKDAVGVSDLTDSDYIKYVYDASDPVNKKIIQWSTGLFGRKPISSTQIARKLRMTPSAISQRKTKIQQQYQQIKEVL